jgi:hypothetical protein
MDIELKSDATQSERLVKVDWVVLRQAVERITVRMHLIGYLSLTFYVPLSLTLAFAVSNRSAWCLVAKRGPRNHVVLRVRRIAHASVTRLWME